MIGHTITGAPPLVAPAGTSAAAEHVGVRSDQLASTAAFAGVALLMILAPFERTEPLVRFPAQSITSLEAGLLAAFIVWGSALVWSRRAPLWRTPVTAPWLLFLSAMTLAALAAPAARLNALHMTGRCAAAFGIYLLAANGVTTRRRLVAAAALAVAAGAVISVLAILEYLKVPAVLAWLKAFRPHVMAVGAIVRAGGPLQYPTIASMYLEVVFAIGVGLMVSAADLSRRSHVAALFATLLLIAHAIMLTFTRSGLTSMAAALALVATVRVRSRGFEAGGALIAVLAACVATLFFASRSIDSIWLRFTTEGQESWYRASVRAPAEVTFGTSATMTIPVALTNTGRLLWDSQGDAPFFLSYHWMQPDGDRYVTFDGVRTPFESPVAPGDTATMRATVQAPQHPGRYRLVWDIVQERRLWFSSEPGAVPAISRATVEGPPIGGPLRTLPPSRPIVRPGRLALWRAAARMFAAHPLLGVGPDNFRLSYAAYAGLRVGDPRMHSNNMYIETLAGGGLLAGLAFVWLLWRAAGMCAAAVGLTRQGSGAIATGIAAAGVAIALHGLVDSFLGFAPTYILFSLTLGLAAACARGVETRADAHRV